MTHKPSLLRELFSMFSAANAAAAATREHRNPRARDLHALGIKPEQFRAVGR
jgi:hypothetical protein